MKFKVVVIESERGWGQKVDEIKYFDDLREAHEFVEKVNSENNLPSAPDLYWYANDPVRVE